MMPLPLKNTTPLFLAKPHLNRQTVQVPLFRQSPLYIGFLWTHPKSRIFQWSPKILKFFILNTILLLKVTKFLDKISQFEFFFMTEKNIFAYKLFLSLIIWDFNLFFMWKLQPPWKRSPPLFPSNPPLEVEIPSSPSLLKIWLEAQLPPPPGRKGGVHTM